MKSTLKPGLRTHVFKFARKHLIPFSFLTPSEQFFKRGGNRLLVPEHQLSDCVYLDFGGFKGDWIRDCLESGVSGSFLVFEPIHEYAQHISQKFSHIPDVQVFEFALGPEEGEALISLEGPSSSLFFQERASNSLNLTKIAIKPFSSLESLILHRNIKWVKMNIEGSEYELLEFLVKTDLIKRIETLVIQFHRIEGFDLNSSRQLLGLSHNPSWSYDYVWERWDLKST